jgi:prepilin-type N-terminal cleavage/methylation domain-containing protein
MRRPARGFTLIEQIAAITLAGAASAVAVPALVDLQADAQAATLRSLATAAMVLNQAGCLVTGQSVQAGKCSAVRQCGDVAELLLAGVPPGYRVADAALGNTGTSTICQLVQDPGGAEAPFIGIAAAR